MMVTGVCRRLPSSLTLHVTHQGAARDGGPVVLRPVRAIPCWTSDMTVSTAAQRVHLPLTNTSHRIACQLDR